MVSAGEVCTCALACSDCVFNSLRGPVESTFAVFVSESAASFDSCRFRALSHPEANPVETDWSETHVGRLNGAMQFEGINTTVVMTNCTIEKPRQAWPIVLDVMASFFSDDADLKVRSSLPQYTDVCMTASIQKHDTSG